MNRIAATFLKFVSSKHRNRLIEQAAGEVARQCRDDLWKRLWHKTSGMSAAEIRGYARAQASMIVEECIDPILAGRSILHSQRARVVASSIDQLVAMAVRDALSDQMVMARPMAA
jgi:hypothetical protein